MSWRPQAHHLQFRFTRTTWRETLRFAAFLAIEGLAEACRRHLCASVSLLGPWLTLVGSAVLVQLWLFMAHGQWTFRDTCAARLDRLAPFLASGLGALTLLAIVAKLSVEAVVVAWPLVMILKFLVVSAGVWPSMLWLRGTQHER